MDMIFIEILQLNCYTVPELPPSRNPLHNCTTCSLLHEINTQEWNSSVSDNKKLSLYKSVKNRFVYEDYFDVFNVRKSRYCYVNFRIESNVLGVELALYKNTPHELHFLLVCVTTIVLLDHHICPNITANILLYSK